MSLAKVELWNRAASLAGGKSKIVSLTDKLRERELCEVWHDQVRRHVLGAAFWPSARTNDYLTLLATRTTSAAWARGDPAPEFIYSYRLPVGLLRPRFLSDYSRFRLSWDISRGEQTISTNTSSALLDFTFDQEDINQWDTGLYSAIMHGIAAMLVVELNGKDVRRRELMMMADKAILDARVDFANANFEPVQLVPDWFQVRGYGAGAPPTQYFHPYETLLSETFGSVNA